MDTNSRRYWDIVDLINNDLDPRKDINPPLNEEEMEVYLVDKYYFDKLKEEMKAKGMDPSKVALGPVPE